MVYQIQQNHKKNRIESNTRLVGWNEDGWWCCTMSPKEEKKAQQDPTKGSNNPLFNFLLKKLSKLKNLKGKRLKFLKENKGRKEN